MTDQARIDRFTSILAANKAKRAAHSATIQPGSIVVLKDHDGNETYGVVTRAEALDGGPDTREVAFLIPAPPVTVAWYHVDGLRLATEEEINRV